MSAVLLAACGGPATACGDIGANPGVLISVEEYLSTGAVGHMVEVCAGEICGREPINAVSTFITLNGLQEETKTAFSILISDQQGERVRSSALDASPSQFKPGGEACDFSVALLRLTLAADGTARAVSG